MGHEEHLESAEPEVVARIQNALERQPFMQHLGAVLGHVAPGRVHVVLPRRPDLLQQHGFIHAGATCAIGDCAGEYAALTLVGTERTDLLGIEHKINFVAPAKGDAMEAIGTVVRAGRTLTVCAFEVWGVEAGQRTLVAAGQQTLIQISRTPPS